jgi:hypothetical protein
VNGDGFVDVLAMTSVGPSVILGHEYAPRVAPTFIVPPAARATLTPVGDADLDGFADLAFATALPTGTRITLLRGGAQRFTPTVLGVVPVRGPVEARLPAFLGAPWDTDGDGRPELLLTRRGDATPSGDVSVLLLPLDPARFSSPRAVLRADPRMVGPYDNGSLNSGFGRGLNGLGDEDQTDFAAALALEPERAAGRRLPKGTPLPLALRYRHVVRFAEQLRRLQEALGASNVHVIIQEEMRGQTEATVAALYAFAGLRPIPTPELGEVNTHKEVRSEGLRRLLRWLPAGIKSLLPDNARAEARRALRRLNSEHRPRAGMDPALRAQLDRELRPEIESVEQLLGRPIPAWRRPAP